MVREAGPDANNPRGRASHRILGTTTRFSFDDGKKAVFDTHVTMADELLPPWLATLRKSAMESTVVGSRAGTGTLGSSEHGGFCGDDSLHFVASCHLAHKSGNARNF